MGQGTGLVGQREAERGLVDGLLGYPDGVVQDEEAGEIFVVGFDLRSEDFQSEFLGGEGRGNGPYALQPFTGDVRGAFGRIFAFDHLDPGALSFEEGAGLVDGHVVGADFPDVFHFLSGKGHEVLVNLQIDLSLDLLGILAKEVEVGQQSAGNGILDSHDSSVGAALRQGAEQVAERGAFHDRNVLILAGPVEIAGCLLMETAGKTLYGYPLHACFCCAISRTLRPKITWVSSASISSGSSIWAGFLSSRSQYFMALTK